jgi:hypothetical protein
MQDDWIEDLLNTAGRISARLGHGAGDGAAAA